MSKFFNNHYRNLKFPPFVKDKEFKNLITVMLCKNIMQRTFKLPGIKSHNWMSNFNWDKLINMSITPPLKPKVKKEDLSNMCLFTKYVKVKFYIDLLLNRKR